MEMEECFDHMVIEDPVDQMEMEENFDHMVMQWAVISRVGPSVGSGHLWGRLM